MPVTSSRRCGAAKAFTAFLPLKSSNVHVLPRFWLGDQRKYYYSLQYRLTLKCISQVQTRGVRSHSSARAGTGQTQSGNLMSKIFYVSQPDLNTKLADCQTPGFFPSALVISVTREHKSYIWLITLRVSTRCTPKSYLWHILRYQTFLFISNLSKPVVTNVCLWEITTRKQTTGRLHWLIWDL